MPGNTRVHTTGSELLALCTSYNYVCHNYLLSGSATLWFDYSKPSMEWCTFPTNSPGFSPPSKILFPPSLFPTFLNLHPHYSHYISSPPPPFLTIRWKINERQHRAQCKINWHVSGSMGGLGFFILSGYLALLLGVQRRKSGCHSFMPLSENTSLSSSHCRCAVLYRTARLSPWVENSSKSG